MLLTRQEQAQKIRQMVEEIGFREIISELAVIAQEEADYYKTYQNDWVVYSWFKYYEKAGELLRKLNPFGW